MYFVNSASVGVCPSDLFHPLNVISPGGRRNKKRELNLFVCNYSLAIPVRVVAFFFSLDRMRGEKAYYATVYIYILIVSYEVKVNHVPNILRKL